MKQKLKIVLKQLIISVLTYRPANEKFNNDSSNISLNVRGLQFVVAVAGKAKAGMAHPACR